MRILVVWVGAIVPAYRTFFDELAGQAEVHILTPKKWTHGSVPYHWKKCLPSGSESYRLNFTRFWPGDSKYLLPGLPAHLLRIRPDRVYFMDELDRLNLTLHIIITKIFAPTARVVTYALQNLEKPAYYGWSHRIALSTNTHMVNGVIAASSEAGRIVRKHGFTGPLTRIPLSASPDFFSPVSRDEKIRLQAELGLTAEAGKIIVYAGSLVQAKGVSLLAEILPRFPHFVLVTAGDGPLRTKLQDMLGSRFLWRGALRGRDLVRFYQCGDYVLLPSRDTPAWKEQVGRSLIEGILCGCLGLGSDSGSIPEVVGLPELLFKQNDPESLASLLASLPLRDEEGWRARQLRHVSDIYAHPVCARQTAEFMAGLAT